MLLLHLLPDTVAPSLTPSGTPSLLPGVPRTISILRPLVFDVPKRFNIRFDVLFSFPMRVVIMARRLAMYTLEALYTLLPLLCELGYSFERRLKRH